MAVGRVFWPHPALQLLAIPLVSLRVAPWLAPKIHHPSLAKELRPRYTSIRLRGAASFDDARVIAVSGRGFLMVNGLMRALPLRRTVSQRTAFHAPQLTPRCAPRALPVGTPDRPCLHDMTWPVADVRALRARTWSPPSWRSGGASILACRHCSSLSITADVTHAPSLAFSCRPGAGDGVRAVRMF